MKFRLIAKTNTDPGHNFSIRRNYNFYSPVLFSRIPSLDQTRLYVYNYRSVSIKRATKNTIALRRLLIYTTKRLSVYLSFDLEESRRCCSHWEDRSLWKVYPVAEDIFCPFSSFSLLFFSVVPRVYPRTRRKASTKNFLSLQRTSISLIAACYASPLYTLYVEILISRVEDIDAYRTGVSKRSYTRHMWRSVFGISYGMQREALRVSQFL